MSKKLLFALPLMVIALAACNANKQSGLINLSDANSKLIGTPKEDPKNPNQTLPMVDGSVYVGDLPTYHHRNKGDVPYVSVSELAKALGQALPAIITPGMTVENKDDGYHLYSPDKKGEYIIDATNDVIKVKNTQSFVTPILVENNGVAGDYTIYRGNSIRESEKTKVYKEDGSAVPVYDSFDFKKYGFDIVIKDNNCFVPLEAFTKVLLRDVSVDLSFNGKDYFTTASNSSFLASWVYSSKGYFQGLSGLYTPSKNKGSEEEYRFEYPTKKLKPGSQDEFEDYTRFLVLLNGGSSYSMICKGDKLDPSAAISDVESDYSYVWKKEGDLLKVNVSDSNGLLGAYHIHLDETRFLSSKISKEVSEYNYNTLRFVFDYIYGLKEIKGYKDAVGYFKSAGVDEGLKSTKPDEYNRSFAKLIGYIDDGHTGFNNMSHYSSYSDLDNFGEYTKLSRSGERMKKLVANSEKYMKARMDKAKELNPDDQNPEDPNYYQGIKFSDNKETAIIAFNGFGHNDKEILNMKELFPDPNYDVDEANYNIFTRAKLIFSTPDGFSQAFKILDLINKNQQVVKNVVFDLTTNGGGEIATMAYLAAFFSDDPVYTVKDVTNGVIKEYHYKVDLNGDGKFGDVGDTYKGKFNFYFLTSGFSFSCGNCLPGMGKDAGAKIIGETSGGGTSPVGVYFDAVGSYFNLSNHYDMCYKVNGKYVQNDAGITLDHSFPLENGNWYDPNAVHTFIKSL